MINAIREYLSVDLGDGTKDKELKRLIESAKDMIEGFSNRILFEKDYILSIKGNSQSAIKLPLKYVKQVTAVKYLDNNFIEADLDFTPVQFSDEFYIQSDLFELDKVYKVNVVVGLSDTELPNDLKQGIIEIVISKYKDLNERLGVDTKTVHIGSEVVTTKYLDVIRKVKSDLSHYKKITV